MSAVGSPAPIIEGRGLTKHFGGAVALHEVDLMVRRGTVHALVGENGAGKSTLAKIVAGIHRPDRGTLLVNGEERHHHSPAHALRAGVTIMSQELTLLPGRSVLDNVYLGVERTRRGWLDRSGMLTAFEELCGRVGLKLPPERRVGDLRIADQQKVELLRALARDAELIVLDEPTAALSSRDAEHLLERLARFRDGGLSIVYVSHFLDEVLGISDEVTVLRDGRFVLTGAAREQSPASLVTAMAGRSLDVAFPERTPAPADGETVLAVDGLASRDGMVADVSFSVRRGEIVCLAGLVGSGRTETVRCVFGADAVAAGTIRFRGRTRRWRHPRQAIAAGVTLIPESRKNEGIVPNRSVGENLSLIGLSRLSTRGWISGRRERSATHSQIDALDIRPTDDTRRIADLSGGNQQKALFGRTLMPEPDLLIIDEPTRGVDVGAKRAIYDLIAERAAAGLAVLMVSSETDEVLGLAHRVLVMREGRIVAELDGAATTKEEFVSAAFTSPTKREDR